MRVEDWTTRLYDLLDGWRGPLVWGQRDCGALAAAVILAVTGRDHFAPWRGRYSTRAEALAVLGEAGGLESVITAAVGAPVAPQAARRGDLVAVPAPAFGVALGVADGRCGVFQGRRGLIAIPRGRWCLSWGL